MDIKRLVSALQNGDFKALARAISIVENEAPGHEQLLQSLSFSKNTPVIGITGPPGAGKSTLVNAIIKKLSAENKKIGVVAIDPTSPFNFGALLGDRIRLAGHYNNPNIFIRSLASRGSLGGLSEKIIEVTDVMRAAGFDYIFVETVGVGQSEVEVAGLADTTVVALVPESGDEVQAMKAGLMEIADIFVVNKADRENATAFAKNLERLVHTKINEDWAIPVLKTIGNKEEGIEALLQKIQAHSSLNCYNEKKAYLLTQKALKLIQRQRMKDIDVQHLHNLIQKELKECGSVNLYKLVEG